MRFRISTAWVTSFLFHAALIGLIVWVGFHSPERAAGPEDYIVAVDILLEMSDTTSAPQEGSISEPEKKGERPTQQEMTRKAHSKEGGDAKGSLQALTPLRSVGGGGSNQTLTQIKAKIEAAKRYPRIALKKKLEGRPTVLFEINPDGSIRYVQIARSSGETVLDNAALETVRRAAPLPNYPKPIQLAIRYELR